MDAPFVTLYYQALLPLLVPKLQLGEAYSHTKLRLVTDILISPAKAKQSLAKQTSSQAGAWEPEDGLDILSGLQTIPGIFTP